MKEAWKFSLVCAVAIGLEMVAPVPSRHQSLCSGTNCHIYLCDVSLPAASQTARLRAGVLYLFYSRQNGVPWFCQVFLLSGVVVLTAIETELN